MNEEQIFSSQDDASDFSMALEKKDAFDELFKIKVENFQMSCLESAPGIIKSSKHFKFDTTKTIISIFRSIDKLSKKPELYYHFSISPNLLFVSTLKHRLGI